MKETTWLKIYKFSFWAYLATLLVLVAFNVWGSPAVGYAGEDVGLDPMAIAFLIIAASTIILSVIILLPSLSLRVKHTIHYIISVLIFIILLFDAWWLYNEISDQDYTPFFGFFIFFVFVSVISFYALVKRRYNVLLMPV